MAKAGGHFVECSAILNLPQNLDGIPYQVPLGGGKRFPKGGGGPVSDGPDGVDEVGATGTVFLDAHAHHQVASGGLAHEGQQGIDLGRGQFPPALMQEGHDGGHVEGACEPDQQILDGPRLPGQGRGSLVGVGQVQQRQRNAVGLGELSPAQAVAEEGLHGLGAPLQRVHVGLMVQMGMKEIEQLGLDTIGKARIFEAVREIGQELAGLATDMEGGIEEARFHGGQQSGHGFGSALSKGLADQADDLAGVHHQHALFLDGIPNFGVRALAFPKNGLLKLVQVLQGPSFQLQAASQGFQAKVPVLHALNQARDQKGQLGFGEAKARQYFRRGLGEQFRGQVIHGPAKGLLTGRESGETEQDGPLGPSGQHGHGLAQGVPERDGIGLV